LITRDFDDYYTVALAAAAGGRARLEILRGDEKNIMQSAAFDSARWGVTYVQRFFCVAVCVAVYVAACVVVLVAVCVAVCIAECVAVSYAGV